MTTFMNDWKKGYAFKDGHLIKLDDDGIIPDGASIRVPMMMTDGKAKEQPAISDFTVHADAHFAKTGMSSRSGSYTPEQQKAREDRQTAYDRKLSDAWREPFETNSNVYGNQLNAAEQVAAKEQAEKGAAERAASPNAGYDRRISNAWKDAGGAPAVVHAAKPNDATATLDAARQRYHQRLEDGWKQEASQ